MTDDVAKEAADSIRAKVKELNEAMASASFRHGLGCEIEVYEECCMGYPPVNALFVSIKKEV